MISLFRKIRQQLLQENKVTRYLTYAIGEIFLVVIGILIALQINTWNESRKTKKFEQEILFLIDQNLQQDSVLLAEELFKAKNALELTDRLLEQVALKNYDDSLNFWMGKIISFERFKSQSSAFEVLKAKGIETISEIRQIADTATPPVAILVTAHSTEAALRRDKANVVDGILIKPVTCQALLKLVADRRTSDTLPARPDPDGEDAGNRRTPLHGRRLLLVEDNAVNQVVAQRILQHAGAVVELAEDGEQAINRLADPGAPAFDLVLMDVQMPVLDGLAATRLIREQLGLQVPIVAMSAGVMASEKKRCLESGMNDFIGKPFGVAEIITLIQRHIRSARPGNVSIVSTAVGSPIPPAAISAGVLQVPGFDLTATLRRFDNDHELLNTSLLLFMREFQDLASQIERACRQGEEHELRYLVHKFRGSAANLGAVQLSSLAQEAEAALDAGRPHRHLIEAVISTWQTTLPLLRAALAEPEAAVSARQGP